MAGRSCGVSPTAKRQGEEKRIEHRTVQVDVEGEDADHQKQRDLHQQVAEAPHAAFEVRLGRAQLETFGDFAELGVLARGHDQGGGAPRDDVSPQENEVDALAERGIRGQDGDRLLGRECLAGQRRLVCEKIARFEDEAIARSRSPGRKQDDVTGHHGGERQVHGAAVAQDLRLHLNKRKKLFDGSGRAALLPETEEATGQDDRQDDRRIRTVMQEDREDRRSDEQEHDRAGELPDQQREGVRAPFDSEPAACVTFQPSKRLDRRQPLLGGVE